MSRAFTKEDPDIPERMSRKRSGRGLPPGAVNYLTERGAEFFRRELATLEERARAEDDSPVAAERRNALRELLAQATVVPTRTEGPAEVLFGTSVTLRAEDGRLTRYRIVGVDETDLDPDALSWCSPLAKILLGTEIGQLALLPDGGKAKIVEIAP
jgi:transcription elongation factor GreB